MLLIMNLASYLISDRLLFIVMSCRQLFNLDPNLNPNPNPYPTLKQIPIHNPHSNS